MRKRTTTKQLSTAITNNLLQVIKAECNYKSSDRIDEISKEIFKESLDYLIESGIFADFVDWHFERNLSDKDGYIFNSGAMNPFTENIVTVYLRVCEGVDVEDIEKTLLFEEE